LGNRDCSLPVNVLVGLTSENHCEAEGADACKIEAFAIDNSGNEGLLVERTFSVDLTNPTIDTVVVTTPTSIPTQTITGTFTETNIDTITVNGVPATLGSGTYSAVDIPLVEGPNTITVVATDFAGNTGTNSDTVTLDTQAPSIVHTQIVAKRAIETSTEISATVTDDSGIFSVILNYVVDGVSDSVSMTGSGDTYTATLPSSSTKGIAEYNIIAEDNAGKTQTSSTFTITVNDLIWDLNSQWNLVSVPKTLVIGDKATLLPGNTVHRYDAVTGTWVTNPATIEPGIGYWVDNAPLTSLGLDFAGDCTGPFCLPSGTINIDALQGGWNLIGLTTTQTDKTVGTAFSSEIFPEENLPVFYVIKYDETEDEFVSLIAENPMNPGEGYWVYVIK